MAKQKLLCPDGHKLPHVLSNGAQCTPAFCAVQNMGNALAKKKEEAIADRDDEAIAMEKAKRHSSLAISREKLRKKLVERPEFPDAKAAEEWTQDRVVKLLPDALAEVEYQLRFGDDAQRMGAARDILDANGMRRRDATASGGQTIILHMNSVLPWQDKAQVTIDAAKLSREVAEGKTEAVRKHLPEQLRRPADVDSGRGPAAEREVNQPDPGPVHQGPDEA